MGAGNAGVCAMGVANARHFLHSHRSMRAMVRKTQGDVRLEPLGREGAGAAWVAWVVGSLGRWATGLEAGGRGRWPAPGAFGGLAGCGPCGPCGLCGLCGPCGPCGLCGLCGLGGLGAGGLGGLGAGGLGGLGAWGLGAQGLRGSGAQGLGDSGARRLRGSATQGLGDSGARRLRGDAACPCGARCASPPISIENAELFCRSSFPASFSSYHPSRHISLRPLPVPQTYTHPFNA